MGKYSGFARHVNAINIPGEIFISPTLNDKLLYFSFYY